MSLSDPDISVRRRCVDLLYEISNTNVIEKIVDILLE